ncbi:MAG: ribbon-helix-helix domain-containing protein [Nanoarchaeota archaeon]|nr:ribbon-helix-helix domain-containing protein [Nanoarchaeota archaeon]
MEVVSVKFQENVLKKIDGSINKHNFNSRTEFIREAVRDKLEELNREELIQEFMKMKGKSKKKTTYEENRKTREEVGKELMKKYEKKFSL